MNVLLCFLLGISAFGCSSGVNGGYCGCGNNVVIFVCVVMLVRGGDKVENRCHLGVVDVRCIWQFRKIV